MIRLIFVSLVVALFGQASDHLSVLKTLGCIPNADGQMTLVRQGDCRPCKRPGSETENKWPDVTELELDKTELHLPPPKEGSPPGSQEYSREMFVSVKTTAEDPEGDVITYNYTISGGRIVGTGANVSWN